MASVLIAGGATGIGLAALRAFRQRGDSVVLVDLDGAPADELSPQGIRVNCICPGWIDTPFNDTFWHHQDDPDAALEALVASIPMRRQGTPEDVAGTVLYLASPASAYVTGQALVVDGGYLSV